MAGDAIDALVAAGRVGGRTVQISEHGEVGCVDYPPAPLAEGSVLVRTMRTAVSPGTEMTLIGRDASNIHLGSWFDPGLRVFRSDRPGRMSYPVTFGYRASGEVVESRSHEVAVGTRLFGSWRHTELVQLPGKAAATQVLPDPLSWDDGVDLGHLAPICLNAVCFGERQQRGHPAVVFGAGVIGLITAQLVRASGARPVYVVDRLSGRLAIAERLGSEPLDASGSEDLAILLKRRHGAAGTPVVWECSGSARALHEGIRVVRRQGTVVCVGFYQGEATGLSLGAEFHHNGVRLVSAQIGNVHRGWSRPGLRRRALAMALAGRLVLGGLPRETFPVERAADAFAALSRPNEVLQVALSYTGAA